MMSDLSLLIYQKKQFLLRTLYLRAVLYLRITIQIWSFKNRLNEEYLVFSRYIFNTVCYRLNSHVHTFREINTAELDFLDSMISERFCYRF